MTAREKWMPNTDVRRQHIKCFNGSRYIMGYALKKSGAIRLQ